MSLETQDLAFQSQEVGTADCLLLNKPFLGFTIFLFVFHHFHQTVHPRGLLAASGLWISFVGPAKCVLEKSFKDI